MRKKTIRQVVDFFSHSHDFNGILISSLCNKLGISLDRMKEILADLVMSGDISLSFASHSINPHIKRLPDLPVSEQLLRLKEESPDSICVYPSSDNIKLFVDLSEYEAKPFSKRLALAQPQLAPVFFDLSVLEQYFRDPRYKFQFFDYAGSICISTEHYKDKGTSDRDKILLQTFGIGYNKNRQRVVVVYLRYLAALSSEHQQIWLAHKIEDTCTMNSDYARSTINGKWPEHYSVYRAFLTEQIEINKLSELIGKPPFFINTYKEDRPPGFIPLLRPTKHTFYQFVHLLDKLLSDNINIDFFKDDIPLEEKLERPDGSIEARRIGSLKLLENWLHSKYRTSRGEDVSKEIVATLKEVRRIRQKPAHSIKSDEYDISLPNEQDRLLGEACRSLTRFRIILSSHPKARGVYEPPGWLDGNKIVFY